MARRRTKSRTHLAGRKASGPIQASSAHVSMGRDPKSMVIRIGAGEVGPSVSQLAKDVRSMMEPGTASRLKERKSNRLRDYVTMAGPLGVSHLLLFSRSESGNTNLRVAVTPRGPTLHFRIEKYSLCKDVQKAAKHPKGGAKEFLSPPLLVMNNFMTPISENNSQPAVPKHLEQLTTSIFQSLFPPISPQTTPLTSIRRVLLLNRETTSSKDEEGEYVLNLRHYAITTKPTGLSRGIRRLNAAEQMLASREKRGKGLPNLGKLEDVADYLLDPAAATGYASTSESEVETDAEVEVLENGARRILNAKQREALRNAPESIDGSTRSNVEKRAVKLIELGPRMRLRMTKVEEGLCNGKIMWHEYLHKTKEEVKKLDKVWEERRAEKERRKKEQKDNVERKRRERKGTDKATEKEVGEDEMDEDLNDWDSEDIDSDGANDDMEVDQADQGVRLKVPKG